MSTPKISPNKTFIIYMYSYPGAGKTAFARQLAEEINCAHLQQDRLNHELYGSNTAALDKMSRKAMNYMTREFLRAGVSVIYDTHLPRLSERRLLRDAARQIKAVPIMIWLQIDPETAYVRGQKRDRRKTDDHYSKEYTPEMYEGLMNKMQNPHHEEYVVISGKHTFQTQRAAVYKKFYELGLMTPSQMSHNIAKPELVNLVPQTSLGGRTDVLRRNINVR